MPVRLIGSIILLIIVTIFCGFNLGDTYKSDLNLLFHTFHAVPVFLIVLGSFFAGCIVVLPFTFGKRRKHKKEKAPVAAGSSAQSQSASPSEAASGTENASASNAAPEKLSPFAAARKAGKERREKTLAEKAAKKALKEEQKAKKAKAKKSSDGSDASVSAHSENDVPVIK